MVNYLLRRLLQVFPVVLGITAIIFFLIRLSGDPVVLMLPDDAPQQQIDQLRKHLGLDRPLLEQYITFLGRAIQGDFGESVRYRGQSVAVVVYERLPATLQLAGAALLVSVLISIPAGIASALQRNRCTDYVATGFSLLGQAMPNFWLGIMMILVFSVSLGWLPVSGRGGPEHLVLPAISLGAVYAAILTRLLRSSLLEVMGLDYIVTARAKGLSNLTVLMHGLRNALLSYVTVLGLQVASLMGGAVVAEQVFAWPGIGRLLIQAINSRDMAIVQAVVILASVVVMVANLLVDMAYGLLDPRIQYS